MVCMHCKKCLGIICLLFSFNFLLATKKGNLKRAWERVGQEGKCKRLRRLPLVFSYATLTEVPRADACKIVDGTWISHEDVLGLFVGLKKSIDRLLCGTDDDHDFEAYKVYMQTGGVKHPINRDIITKEDLSNLPENFPSLPLVNRLPLLLQEDEALFQEMVFSDFDSQIEADEMNDRVVSMVDEDTFLIRSEPYNYDERWNAVGAEISISDEG